MSLPHPPDPILRALRDGQVIPAHPLALKQGRQLDERRQRALTRYYCEAGAGGVAVGVHTTQFAIRDPKVGLLEPVLSLAAETLNQFESSNERRLIRVAGVVGPTPQAVKEARLATDFGYHLGLVSLGDLSDKGNAELIAHLRTISEIIPIFGFYLQPAIGGRVLDYAFWRETAEIENLVAIKIAPFDRYKTLDVMRAVADSGRSKKIAIYTGNDDNIVLDLLSEFKFGEAEAGTIRIVGGLLGQWAVWTRKAVKLLDEIRQLRERRADIPRRLLVLAQQITDANAAIFDAQNQFSGCIPGIHEILRRQGLLEGRWVLERSVDLSPGQLQRINRICTAYPHLSDNRFVQDGIGEWLG